MKLSGKVAVITGGAGGIGRATAARLVAKGCSVDLWDRDRSLLDDAAAALGADARIGADARLCATRVVDVTDPQAVVAAAADAIALWGRVDIVVNNAGHLATGALLDQPVDTWKTTIDVNLTAVVAVTHAFLPHLYDRGDGHVVNISSASSLVGVSGLAVYSATKWAVWGLTEALRHESLNLGHSAVRFSSVHPNYIATGMFEGAHVPGLGGLVFPRLSSHDVVAKAIVEGALIRGRRTPKRPRSLRLALLLRGILPDAWFAAVARWLGVHASMKSWRGAGGSHE